MSYCGEEILQQLDRCAEQFRFPGFNNMNYHLGTARISAFRSSGSWVILLEEICWWPASEGIVRNLYAFGNCLDEKALAFPGQPAWQQGMVYWPDSPIECAFDECGELSITHLRIRGQSVNICPEDIALVPEVPERGFAVMVHLLDAYREQLLCTPEELRRIVPVELEMLVRLDQWCHPDVYLGELPSQNESFRNLAESLASGDLSRLRPAVQPNVDWRLWLER